MTEKQLETPIITTKLLKMQKSLPPQSIYTKSNDGLQLHYFFYENPSSKACCLLLHGFTNDAHMFDVVANCLSEKMNVLAFDFRGHGDSDWDKEERYQHADLMADVFTLINRFDFTQWHFVGHSLGARVAMLTIEKFQLSPSSLTIIDTGPEVNAIGVRKVRKDAENTPMTFESIEAYYQFLSRIYFLADPERLKYLAQFGLKNLNGQLVAKTDPAFTRALWKADSNQGNANDLKKPLEHDLWQTLNQITCPTLILRGQASAILTQTTAEEMQARLANATLTIVPGAGHALMLDNHEYFEQALCAFIGKNLQR